MVPHGAEVRGERRRAALRARRRRRLDEEIVTNDGDLRRFQSRITGGGVPVTSHLGTVDVLAQNGTSLVVYSTEVTPDEVAGTLGPAIEDGLRGLKTYCESQG